MADNAMHFGPAALVVGFEPSPEQHARLAEGWCPEGHGRLDYRGGHGWCQQCRAGFSLDRQGAWVHSGTTEAQLQTLLDAGGEDHRD